MGEQPEMELKGDYLKEQSFLKGLSDEQILYLYKQSKQEEFLPNEVIIAEGEKTTDIYLILEGEVSVLKWDEDHNAEVVIGRLSKGDTFGEMSFMDNSPRSTTIKAAKPAILLKLTKETIFSEKDILMQLYANIAIVNINRLRSSNKLFIKNLQTIQQLFQIREHIGQFLIYLYLILGLAVLLANNFFSGFFQMYLPWFITAIPAIYMIKANQFEFSHFGLNIRHWFSIILGSCLALTLVLGLVYFANIFFKLSMPLISLEQFSKDWTSLNIWPLYAVYAFAQEFVARGVLQTALEDFLHDERGYKSWITNAIFLFLFFLPLGLQLAIHLFLIGLPMGLLYLKQRSILGIAFIHFILLCFFVPA